MPQDRSYVDSRFLDYPSLVEEVEKLNILDIRDIDFRELTVLAEQQELSFLNIDIRRQFIYGMGLMNPKTTGFSIHSEDGSLAFLAAIVPLKGSEAVLAGVGLREVDSRIPKREKIKIALEGLHHIFASPYDTFHCHAHQCNLLARNMWAQLARATRTFKVTESPADTGADNFIRITLEKI